MIQRNHFFSSDLLKWYLRTMYMLTFEPCWLLRANAVESESEEEEESEKNLW
jgi:hypothetical protein